MKTNLTINGSIIKLNILFVKSSPKTVQHTITPKSRTANFKLVTFSPTNFFTSPETFSHFHKQNFMGFPYKSSIVIAQAFKIKKLKKAKTFTWVSQWMQSLQFSGELTGEDGRNEVSGSWNRRPAAWVGLPVKGVERDTVRSGEEEKPREKERERNKERRKVINKTKRPVWISLIFKAQKPGLLFTPKISQNFSFN